VLGFGAATLTTLPEGGQPTTVATTDQQVLAVDHAQYEEGPGRASRRWTTSALGSLNLYARSRRTMGAAQIRAASVFAAQLAAAMKTVESYEATARMASGLAVAMRTRAVIEQAKGMLMAERGITEDEAFDVQRALSQRSNTKLRKVARRIVQERTAP
jgi:ANTAR domain-containing protein